MAIDLNSVRKAKNSNKQQLSTTDGSSAIDQKDQLARPWESFDGLGPKVRTVQAHEAIRKITARKLHQQNQVVVSFKMHKEKKNVEAPENIFNHVNAPLSGSGLKGFIRRLFS